MSTRGRIGILNDDGTVDSIYCHYDNYLSHNGKILLQHYTLPAKVAELIALGDISSLAPEIGEKHPFDNPHPWNTQEYQAHQRQYENWVNAYGRDREETDVDSTHSKTVEDFRNIGCWTEYWYLFCDGEWLVSSDSDAFEPLEQALARYDAEQAAE